MKYNNGRNLKLVVYGCKIEKSGKSIKWAGEGGRKIGGSWWQWVEDSVAVVLYAVQITIDSTKSVVVVSRCLFFIFSFLYFELFSFFFFILQPSPFEDVEVLG